LGIAAIMQLTFPGDARGNAERRAVEDLSDPKVGKLRYIQRCGISHSGERRVSCHQEPNKCSRLVGRSIGLRCLLPELGQ
jgi:hypothetical protein